MSSERMHCDITLDPGLVRVTCRGSFDQTETLRIYGEAFEVARREGRNGVLVDAREVTPPAPSLADRYDQGVLVARLSAEHRWAIRMAIVAQPSLLDPDRVGEVVATNRMANARVFDDIEKAGDWLADRGAKD